MGSSICAKPAIVVGKGAFMQLKIDSNFPVSVTMGVVHFLIQCFGEATEEINLLASIDAVIPHRFVVELSLISLTADSEKSYKLKWIHYKFKMRLMNLEGALLIPEFPGEMSHHIGPYNKSDNNKLKLGPGDLTPITDYRRMISVLLRHEYKHLVMQYSFGKIENMY
jgi:hypothetical protein